MSILLYEHIIRGEAVDLLLERGLVWEPREVCDLGRLGGAKKRWEPSQGQEERDSREHERAWQVQPVSTRELRVLHPKQTGVVTLALPPPITGHYCEHQWA
jgi:hypothetical protein